MDVLHLLGSLRVEVDELLARGGAGRLLKVRPQPRKERVGLLGHAVGLVDALGLVGGVVLGIEVLKGGEEAVGDAVLVVKVDGSLDGLVSYDVAMGHVLGDDAGSRLLLLRDLVAVSLGVLGEVASVVVVAAAGRSDLDVAGSELRVVEKEGRLGRGLLLECDGGTLGLLGGTEFDGADLTTGGGEECQ